MAGCGALSAELQGAILDFVVSFLVSCFHLVVQGR